MDALLLIVVTFAGYIIAYHTYGRFLANRVFKLNPKAPVPSHEREDGVDYVPTRRGIIFGHHFTSIAGTGPIVGPAIGIIWGWVPALLWVFLGSIAMGAVHDLGSLVISLRNDGKSIAEIVGRYINPRVRFICFVVVFLALWIVIAIFGLIMALLFAMYPSSVLPIWTQIPIAVALGYLIYKKKWNVVGTTAVAVLLMYATIVWGAYRPLAMPAIAGLPATGVWVVILLIYAYIASTIPVTTLLQPRDYINAWQLFIAMGLLIAGAIGATFTKGLDIVAPAFQMHPEGAPPLWPFLFVTIACGAISGFHSLVASGTSPKQVAKETDALMVGYGSMLLEGALAVLVIVAVAAGIGMAYRMENGTVLSGVTGIDAWNNHYASWGAAGGLKANLSAVVVGASNMLATIGIPFQISVVIMGVFIVSFAGTTLDTATRIQRYVIAELATDLKLKPLAGRWTATTIAVVTAGVLAFSTGTEGKGAMKLWPMFGAVNQLLAALALLLVTVYLRKRGGLAYLVTALPCLFMLTMTGWAMVVNEKNFVAGGEKLLAVLNGASLLLAFWMALEGFLAFTTPAAEAALPEAAE
jgi:carbon starvation protein